MRRLTKQNIAYEWDEHCEKAFITLRNSLVEEPAIAFFDEHKDIVLYCDASPVGVSSIILKETPGRRNAKVISYSSRFLTAPEMRYSQIERECLSIAYACQRNRLYLLGRKFTIYTDNKALVNILNNPNSRPPLRIERMILKLQGFTFDTKFVSSNENISDYLSRHPGKQNTAYSSKRNDIEDYVNFVTTYAIPNAFNLDDIRIATTGDHLLQQVIGLVASKQWHKLDDLRADTEEAKAIKHFRNISET